MEQWEIHQKSFVKGTMKEIEFVAKIFMINVFWMVKDDYF